MYIFIVFNTYTRNSRHTYCERSRLYQTGRGSVALD